MSIFSIISLLFTLIFKLPSMISVISQIIKLLPKFNSNLGNDIELIGEIVRLIVGVIPENKSLAIDLLKELLDLMKQTPDKSTDGLHKLKEKCEGTLCPADLK